jgi:hypothetical protein
LKRYLTIVAASAALFALTGCASGPSTTKLECLAATPKLAATIAQGANKTPITPTGRIAAVKSPDFKDAYLVAMEFDAPGGASEIGVWATPNLTGGDGPILAIDGFAHQFTVWPNQMNGEKFSITEPGAADAVACLNLVK